MKSILIGCTCVMFVLLTGAILSSPTETYAQCAVGQSVVTTPTPVYTYEMVLWAKWIWPSCRRRSYRNPLRRYRLTKKQRRRLRQRLRRILKRQVHPSPEPGSPISSESVCTCSGRWC